MSAAVIRRGPARRTAAAKPARPAAMVRVPLAPRRLRRHVATAVVTLVAVAAVAAGIAAGLPGRLWQATAEAAARAGFEVRRLEVHGVATGPRLKVVAAVLDGPTNSMLLVDLAAARERLRAVPWIADASVSRRLPDALIVDIVERRPVALWQFRHRLVVIDRTGQPLTAERLDRFARLPLIVGPDANRHVDALLTLLAASPRLAPQVDAATFVGTRRWDLRFKTGETLALPEADPASAFAKFDGADRTTGLIGHGYLRFDLRQPGQMTVRVAGPVKAGKPVTI